MAENITKRLMGFTVRNNVLDCPHCGYVSELDYAINLFDRVEDEQERATGNCKGCERKLSFRRTAKGFIKVYQVGKSCAEYGEDRVRSGYLENRLTCPKCGHKNDDDEVDKVFRRSKNTQSVSYQCDACKDKLILRRNQNGFYNLYVYYYKYNKKGINRWGQITKS